MNCLTKGWFKNTEVSSFLILPQTSPYHAENSVQKMQPKINISILLSASSIIKTILFRSAKMCDKEPMVFISSILINHPEDCATWETQETCWLSQHRSSLYSSSQSYPSLQFNSSFPEESPRRKALQVIF